MEPIQKKTRLWAMALGPLLPQMQKIHPRENIPRLFGRTKP